VTQSITPHIVVKDAASMADWYRRALGAEERQRVTVPDGRIMSLELRFGDATVMIADEFPEMGIVSPKTLGGTYGALVLATDDVERAWQRAMDAGAEVFHPLQDTFWGDRSGQLLDPSGHRWGLSQHVRDVPADEIQRAAAAAFS
jgi:PhnB protein